MLAIYSVNPLDEQSVSTTQIPKTIRLWCTRTYSFNRLQNSSEVAGNGERERG